MFLFVSGAVPVDMYPTPPMYDSKRKQYVQQWLTKSDSQNLPVVKEHTNSHQYIIPLPESPYLEPRRLAGFGNDKRNTVPKQRHPAEDYEYMTMKQEIPLSKNLSGQSSLYYLASEYLVPEYGEGNQRDNTYDYVTDTSGSTTKRNIAVPPTARHAKGNSQLDISNNSNQEFIDDNATPLQSPVRDLAKTRASDYDNSLARTIGVSPTTFQTLLHADNGVEYEWAPEQDASLSTDISGISIKTSPFVVRNSPDSYSNGKTAFSVGNETPGVWQHDLQFNTSSVMEKRSNSPGILFTTSRAPSRSDISPSKNRFSIWSSPDKDISQENSASIPSAIHKRVTRYNTVNPNYNNNHFALLETNLINLFSNKGNENNNSETTESPQKKHCVGNAFPSNSLSQKSTVIDENLPIIMEYRQSLERVSATEEKGNVPDELQLDFDDKRNMPETMHVTAGLFEGGALDPNPEHETSNMVQINLNESIQPMENRIPSIRGIELDSPFGLIDNNMSVNDTEELQKVVVEGQTRVSEITPLGESFEFDTGKNYLSDSNLQCERNNEKIIEESEKVCPISLEKESSYKTVERDLRESDAASLWNSSKSELRSHSAGSSSLGLVSNSTTTNSEGSLTCSAQVTDGFAIDAQSSDELLKPDDSKERSMATKSLGRLLAAVDAIEHDLRKTRSESECNFSDLVKTVSTSAQQPEVCVIEEVTEEVDDAAAEKPS